MKTVTITWEEFRQLESTVIDLAAKLERAECMVQDVTETYFSYLYEPDSLWKLEKGYDEHRIKSEIARDCIYDSTVLISKIEKSIAGGKIND